MAGLDRLTAKRDEPKDAPPGRRRSRTEEKSTVTTRRQHDGPVMTAAKHFVKRAEHEGLQLARGAHIIYYDLNARVDSSGIKSLKDPQTGEQLRWLNGKPVWPDLLLGMVDEYFDSEYPHGDKYCWQDFCGVETFGRLKEKLTWRMFDHRGKVSFESHRDEIEEGLQREWQETEARLRSVNAQRHTIEPEITAEPARAMTAEDLFGDDLEEYQRLREARRKKIAAKVKRNSKRNPNRALEGED